MNIRKRRTLTYFQSWSELVVLRRADTASTRFVSEDCDAAVHEKADIRRRDVLGQRRHSLDAGPGRRLPNAPLKVSTGVYAGHVATRRNRQGGGAVRRRDDEPGMVIGGVGRAHGRLVRQNGHRRLWRLQNAEAILPPLAMLSHNARSVREDALIRTTQNRHRLAGKGLERVLNRIGCGDQNDRASLPSVVEEATHRARQVQARAGSRVLEVFKAGDSRKQSRTVGGTDESRCARRDPFDRMSVERHFLDVDARSEELRHGRRRTRSRGAFAVSRRTCCRSARWFRE